MLEKIKNLPKIYVFILIIIFLLFGGLYSYFSSKTKEAQESQATPTPLLTLTPVEISPTPTPTATPSPTPKSTPTPSPTSTPPSQTKTLTATSSLDGFRANNGGGNNTIDIRAGNGIFVGLPSFELVTRGFVSFDLTSLPTGATAEKATLRIYQSSVTGTPYAGGNSLIVDHLNYGDSLEAQDFDLAALSSNIGTLTQNPTIEWKDLEVTNSLANDLANARTRSQFRLRFATPTDGDGSEDVAYFESGENYFGTGNTPQLVVKYH